MIGFARRARSIPSALMKAFSRPKPPTANLDKVFVVGFSKTGTKSAGFALGILGYRRATWGPQAYGMVANWHEGRFTETMRDTLEAHDAFDDWPWSLMFKELDERYPTAKFILTRRDEASWLPSLRSHFKRTGNLVTHFLVFGSYDPESEPERFLEVYRRHNMEVLEHFKGRPDKLLIMDIDHGDGWNELCSFLGRPIPDAPFPHRNASPELVG
jgi:hypothetical protein